MQLNKISSRSLVLVISTIFLLSFSLFMIFHETKSPDATPLYVAGQPTLGNPLAKVHVVTFEDPRCNNCVAFHQECFNYLEQNYIKTEKIKYTSYLVSGVPLSSTINQFLFCVNAQSTQAFFQLLSSYYKNPIIALTEQDLQNDLLDLEEESKLNLSREQLNSCTEKKTYQRQTEENTNYAKAIMGGVIKTPTVFVNGIKISRPNCKDLTLLIDQELKKLEQHE
jgi:protein-disulfide isomerase